MMKIHNKKVLIFPFYQTFALDFENEAQ